MTRGNARDLAREKTLKKQLEMNKGRKDDGLSAAARAERDAAIMREKQLKKAAAAAEGKK
eukprot:m.34036 g.34036  ORF g.34036 m.34036 type:complete len:60 (+) comp11090_c0_seq1:128-307(+)